MVSFLGSRRGVGAGISYFFSAAAAVVAIASAGGAPGVNSDRKRRPAGKVAVQKKSRQHVDRSLQLLEASVAQGHRRHLAREAGEGAEAPVSKITRVQVGSHQSQRGLRRADGLYAQLLTLPRSGGR